MVAAKALPGRERPRPDRAAHDGHLRPGRRPARARRDANRRAGALRGPAGRLSGVSVRVRGALPPLWLHLGAKGVVADPGLPAGQLAAPGETRATECRVTRTLGHFSERPPAMVAPFPALRRDLVFQ